MIVRPERDDDRPRILEVVEAAFGKPAERILVERLYDSPQYRPGLSLVAESKRDGIVGHVLVTTAWLDDGDWRQDIASLAPLAVVPKRQRTGVGTALLHAVCAVLDERGEPFVVLQGSPLYYGRVGFEASAPLGITMDLPDWAPQEAAQLRRLTNYAPMKGNVTLPPAFDDLPE
ncbi:MAG: N-acetyltransferase [Acidimicrobiales bacterium]|nr:N-acetyltransferase [Acidimicrobiales bacterium]